MLRVQVRTSGGRGEGSGGPGSQGSEVEGAAISAARRLELRWEQVSERPEPAVNTESPPELVITRLGAEEQNGSTEAWLRLELGQ